MPLYFAPSLWNNGMVETGDPLGGTERSEASAKNIGMMLAKEGKNHSIGDNCQQYL